MNDKKTRRWFNNARNRQHFMQDEKSQNIGLMRSTGMLYIMGYHLYHIGYQGFF